MSALAMMIIGAVLILIALTVLVISQLILRKKMTEVEKKYMGGETYDLPEMQV